MRVKACGLLLIAALAVKTSACNKEWDSTQGQAHLKKAGYTVGPAAADPNARAVAAVKEGECFDVSQADKTARVCVWTCETAQACIAIPQQKVWLHGTFGRRNAYVDSKDEGFGHQVLTALHP